MENKLLDKNSNIHEVVEDLRNKASVSRDTAYPYLSGLCWSLLNETQRKKLAEIVNKMENK
jgi:signal recognition particle subunit SEC65